MRKYLCNCKFMLDPKKLFQGSGKAEQVSGRSEKFATAMSQVRKLSNNSFASMLCRAFWDNLYTFEIQCGREPAKKRGHKVEKGETFPLLCNFYNLLIDGISTYFLV